MMSTDGLGLVPLSRVTTLFLGVISLMSLALPMTALFTTEWVRYASPSSPLVYNMTAAHLPNDYYAFSDLWTGPLLYRATYTYQSGDNTETQLAQDVHGIITTDHPVGALVTSCRPYYVRPNIGGLYIQYDMDQHRCVKFQMAQSFVVGAVVAKLVAALSLLVGGMVPFVRDRVQLVANASFAISACGGAIGLLAFYLALAHPTRSMGFSSIMFIASLPIDLFMILLVRHFVQRRYERVVPVVKAQPVLVP